jgi:hypothetical protein
VRLLKLLYKNTASPYRTGGEIIYKHLKCNNILFHLCGVLKVSQQITGEVTEHPDLPD